VFAVAPLGCGAKSVRGQFPDAVGCVAEIGEKLRDILARQAVHPPFRDEKSLAIVLLDPAQFDQLLDLAARGLAGNTRGLAKRERIAALHQLHFIRVTWKGNMTSPRKRLEVVLRDLTEQGNAHQIEILVAIDDREVVVKKQRKAEQRLFVAQLCRRLPPACRLFARTHPLLKATITVPRRRKHKTPTAHIWGTGMASCSHRSSHLARTTNRLSAMLRIASIFLRHRLFQLGIDPFRVTVKWIFIHRLRLSR